jgi:multidrug efflux pump
MYKNLQKYIDANIPYTCYAWSVSTGLPGFDNDSNSDILLGIISPAPLKQLYKAAEDAVQAVRNSKAFQNIRIDKTQNTTAQKCQLHPFLTEKFKLKREEILNNIEIVLSGRHHLKFFKDNQAYTVDLHTRPIDQDINRVFACNDDDKIFSLGSVVTITQEQILEPILHLNQRRLIQIKMSPKPDVDVATAKKQINEELRSTLTNQESFGWLDNDAMAAKNSQMMMTLFVTALIFIYAILCIQFESFLDPLLILLTVPFASFGALLWLWASGQSLNIFSQIGLITLIGLISKHGILLVEFANAAFKQTQNWPQAFEEAVTKRFRPIVMTTAAMVLGCIPLAIASGPGSEIRQAIAGVLISGLCFGTIGTLFLLPRLATKVKDLYIKS